MLWELTRSTALVGTVALTASVALGVAAAAGGRARLLSQALHRNVTGLAGALIAAHVATVVMDGYVPLSWADAVVPFGTSYHRLGTGLGTLALDLLAVVTLSGLLRHRLGPRAWRALHVGAYLLWPLAVAHGLLVGTDDAAVRLVSLGCGAVVVAAGLLRVARLGPPVAVVAVLTVGGAVGGWVVR